MSSGHLKNLTLVVFTVVVFVAFATPAHGELTGCNLLSSSTCGSNPNCYFNSQYYVQQCLPACASFGADACAMFNPECLWADGRCIANCSHATSTNPNTVASSSFNYYCSYYNTSGLCMSYGSQCTFQCSSTALCPSGPCMVTVNSGKPSCSANCSHYSPDSCVSYYCQNLDGKCRPSCNYMHNASMCNASDYCTYEGWCQVKCNAIQNISQCTQAYSCMVHNGTCHGMCNEKSAASCATMPHCTYIWYPSTSYTYGFCSANCTALTNASECQGSGYNCAWDNGRCLFTQCQNFGTRCPVNTSNSGCAFYPFLPAYTSQGQYSCMVDCSIISNLTLCSSGQYSQYCFVHSDGTCKNRCETFYYSQGCPSHCVFLGNGTSPSCGYRCSQFNSTTCGSKTGCTISYVPTLPDVSCGPSCTNIGIQSACVESGCVWGSSRCYRPCTSATSYSTCTSSYNCVWNFGNSRCSTNCGAFSGSTCQSPENGFINGTCTTVLPGVSSTTMCYTNCGLFTSATTCSNANNCQWVNGACRHNCTGIYRQYGCPAYCQNMSNYVSGLELCRDDCSALLTSNDCASRACLWDTATGVCENGCASRTQQYCLMSSKCRWNGNTCSAKCTLASSSQCGAGEFSSCTSFYGPNSNGNWVTTCVDNCRSFVASANCTGSDTCVPYGTSSTCYAKCSNYESESACSSVSDCHWIAGACQLRCGAITGVQSCPSYCVYTRGNTYPCSVQCETMTTTTTCGSSSNCVWVSASSRCYTRCSSLTSTTCSSNPRCFVSGSTCYPRCSQLLTNTECTSSATSSGICSWNWNQQTCVTHCGAFLSTSTCPTSQNECIAVTSMYSSYTCVNSCFNFTQSACTATSDCVWHDGACTASCNAFYYTTQCPAAYCYPRETQSQSPATCQIRCEAFNSTSCPTSSCTSTAAGCRRRCSLLSATECILQPHCIAVSGRCFANCSEIDSVASCGRNNECQWTDRCRFRCSSYSSGSYNDNGNICRNFTDCEFLSNSTYNYGNCVQRCGAITNATECSLNSEYCQWTGSECRLPCSMLYLGSDCTSRGCAPPTSTSSYATCTTNCGAYAASSCPSGICEVYAEQCVTACAQLSSQATCATFAQRCMYSQYGCTRLCSSALNYSACSFISSSVCRWNYNLGMCLPVCSNFGSYCPVNVSNACETQSSYYSSYNCIVSCGFIADQYNCTAFGGCSWLATEQRCVTACSSYLYANTCPAHCERIGSTTTYQPCRVRCSTLNGTECTNNGCLIVGGVCHSPCTQATTAANCSLLPHCAWFGSSCYTNCSTATLNTCGSTNYNHCRWSYGTSTCSPQCTSFGSSSCPTQWGCVLYSSSSSYTTCQPDCTVLLTRDTCTQQNGYCQWSDGVCRAQCSNFYSTCPSHCTAFQYSSGSTTYCRPSCESISNLTDCSSIGYCVSLNGQCYAQCSYWYSSSTCAASPVCYWSSSSCRTVCSALTTSSSCYNDGRCTWNSYMRMCQQSCPSTDTVSCTASVACQLTGSTSSSRQCIRMCGIYGNETACSSDAACVWLSGQCMTQCDEYVNTQSCPTHCVKTSVSSACQPLCSMSNTSASCARNGCTWINSQCVLPCSNAADMTACSAMQHCVAVGNGQCAINCTMGTVSTCGYSDFSKCRWSTSLSRCLVDCAQYDYSTCETISSKGMYVGQCQSVSSQYSSYGCRRNCSVFATESACGDLSSECTWVGGACRLQCTQYLYVTNCPSSHCSSSATSSSTCVPKCEIITTSSGCSSSYCLWTDTSRCISRCSMSSTTTCATLPHCVVAGSYCRSRCNTTTSSYTCQSNSDYSSHCRWNSGISRCQTYCDYFSSASECVAASNGDCTYLDRSSSAWSSGSYWCVRTCATYGDRTSCNNDNDCFWFGGVCALRCDVNYQTATCPSYCLANPVNSYCKTNCSAIGSDSVTCSRLSCAFDGTANTCRDTCTEQTASNCATLKHCVTIGSSCYFNCSSQRTSNDCYKLSSSYCMWDSNLNRCRFNCMSSFNSGSCPTADCLSAPPQAYQSYGCIMRCNEYTQSTCSANSQCTWSNASSLCFPRCNQYHYLTSPSSSCPSYCLPGSSSSWDSCLTDCSALGDESSCTNHQCLWSNGTCLRPCSQLSSSSTCSTLSHCRWLRNSQTCITDCRYSLSQGTCGSSSQGLYYCQWNSYSRSCVPRCTYFSYSDCPTADSIGSNGAALPGATCTSLYFSNQCVANCSAFADRNTCYSSSGCVWLTTGCRLACSYFSSSSTVCPSSYCTYTTPSSSSSSYTCMPVCSAANTSSDCASHGCRWWNNTCVRACSSMTSSECTASPQCMAVGTSACVDQCSAATTSSTCQSYPYYSTCTWNWQTSTCVPACSNLYSSYSSCPTQFCTKASANSCVPNCAYSTSVACQGDYSCSWVGSSCKPRCSSIYVYPRNGESCPTHCYLTPGDQQSSSSVYCRASCALITDSSSCFSNGCTWAANKCNPTCDSQTSSVCATLPHCMWLNSNNCAVNCTAAGSSGCGSGDFRYCEWRENRCTYQCSQYSYSTCPTAVAGASCMTYDSSSSSSQCVTDCSQFATSTRCNSYSGTCFWSGRACLVVCERLRYASSCPSHCAYMGNQYQSCQTTCSYLPTETACYSSYGVCQWSPSTNVCVDACTKFGTDTTCMAAPHCQMLGSQCVTKCSLGNSSTCGSYNYGLHYCAFYAGACSVACSMFSGTSCPNGCLSTTSSSSGSWYSQCVSPCSSFTNQLDCVSSRGSCQWYGTRCLVQCSAYSVQAGCPSGHCFADNYNSYCQTNCELFNSSSACTAVSECVWPASVGCRRTCSSLDLQSCSAASYCMILSGSCYNRCAQFNATGCGRQNAYHCQWNGAANSCQVRCQYWGGSNCPTNGTGCRIVTNSSSSSSTCMRDCSGYGSQLTCELDSLCTWASGSCQSACWTLTSSGSNCPSYCRNPTAGAQQYSTVCWPICTTQATMSSCNSQNCLWDASTSACRDPCFVQTAATCALVSYCSAVGDYCVAKCSAAGAQPSQCSMYAPNMNFRHCAYVNGGCSINCTVVPTELCTAASSSCAVVQLTGSSRCFEKCSSITSETQCWGWSPQCAWQSGACALNCSVYDSMSCPTPRCAVSNGMCRPSGGVVPPPVTPVPATPAPTPAPQYVVQASFVLSGDFSRMMQQYTQEQVMALILADLAQSLGIPSEQITIDSVKLGSLVVNFTVATTSVASTELSISSMMSTDPEATFSRVFTAFEDAGGASTSFGILAASVDSVAVEPSTTTTPSPGGVLDDLADKAKSPAGIIAGVVVSLLVVGAAVAGVMYYKKNQAATAAGTGHKATGESQLSTLAYELNDVRRAEGSIQSAHDDAML